MNYSSFDGRNVDNYEFIDIDPPNFQPTSSNDGTVFDTFTSHSSAPRICSNSVIVASIRAKHPDLNLTITSALSCDLLRFAGSGNASATPFGDPDEMLFDRQFVPPARRYEAGFFVEQVQFACFKYEYNGATFLLYIVDGRDGMAAYPQVKMNYLLSGKRDKDAKETDGLIEAATRWQVALHEEVLVFDQGWWHQDKELYKAVKKSSWEDVILEPEKKKALIDDVDTFFDGEDSYKEFAVPWKRGVIYYGPPGNGKTISIKALMNSLSERKDPTVELLYVKTLNSMYGQENSVRQIFTKARAMAPCILIFEDIDSMVTDGVRSYFLNEVDGLESNHGILMIGSTNHLERLDPGISKRPSRFDRKYFFDLPTRDERIQYCDYWRNKLKDNKKVDFPAELSEMIADITNDFSFAYMKEAFVASLLSIVGRHGKDEIAGENYMGDGDSGKNKAENSLLWKEIKKQVKNLRDEMESDTAVPEVKKSLITDVPERPHRAMPFRRGRGPRVEPQGYGAFSHFQR